MATELNLNTLNWVSLACPGCSASVQVLEEDLQFAASIRCPGCGHSMTEKVAGPADAMAAEPGPCSAAEPAFQSDPHVAASSDKDAERRLDPALRMSGASDVDELLAALPDADEGESSAGAATDDSPLVEFDPFDQVGSDTPRESVEPIEDGDLLSVEPVATGNAGVDLKSLSLVPPPLPRSREKPIPESRKSRLIAEPDEDEETAPATKLQRVGIWLRVRRPQLTGALFSIAVHVVVLGLLALIVFQIGGLDESDVIDGRISTGSSDAELLTVEETPVEAVTIEPALNQFDLARVTRQQTDPTAQTGDGEVPEISFEGPESLLTTLTAEPKWHTPTGQGLEGRTAENRAQLAMLHGGSEKSEEAVEEGLKWLLRHQRADGSWSFRHQLPTCTARCQHPGLYDCPTGATGLALLCFLGAGYTHQAGPYQAEVGKALHWLVDQSCLGNLQYDLSRDNPERQTGFYAQGLASIALCEAYGMTKDPALHQPAQDALDFISMAQDPVGGGWRYEFQQAGDTSVVGWQVMALVSGRMADLHVARSTRGKVLDFLTAVQTPNGDFGYTTGRYGGTSATTGIGVLCTMYLDPLTARRTLRGKVRQLSRTIPMRENLYANYYISQVLHHFGGNEWKSWNSKMRQSLVRSQLSGGHGAGSWYSTKKHDISGGRLYSTCMSLLILEVYYRHLPLYQQDATLLTIPEVQANE